VGGTLDGVPGFRNAAADGARRIGVPTVAAGGGSTGLVCDCVSDGDTVVTANSDALCEDMRSAAAAES